jgi:hypothetical protein
MNINFSKDSCLSSSYLGDDGLAMDKDFAKSFEKMENDRLKLRGFLFLNEFLEDLGVNRIKRGQFDGWIWDELDSEHMRGIKIKTKVENGDLILIINEEKDIIDYVFKEVQ